MNLHPLAAKILEVLEELDVQCLESCYGLRRMEGPGYETAPLDEAVLSWKEAEHPRFDGQDRQRQALEATLLFFSPTIWRDEENAKFQELTGATEVTSMSLCNFILKVLA